MTTPQIKANPLLRWARKAIEEGDHATAEKVARQALQRSPANAELHNLLGLALGKLRLFDEGIAEHSEALRLDDSDPLFWHNFGVTLSELSTLHRDIESANKAIDAFTMALSLDNTQYTTYACLVAHYMELAMKCESEGRPELEARADEVVSRLFLVAPDVEMPLNVNGLECGDRVYNLKEELNIGVSKPADTLVCEYEPLAIHGEGTTFTESWRSLCEYFDVLYREYVETDEPLHGSAVMLADQLRSLVESHSPPPANRDTATVP